MDNSPKSILVKWTIVIVEASKEISISKPAQKTVHQMKRKMGNSFDDKGDLVGPPI